MTITQSRLQELIDYDPGTGVFRNRVHRSATARQGAVTGCVARNGYVVIRIEGVLYYAHRLAILYVTGELPPKMTDHINGDRTDNRFENLRPATNQENMGNKKRGKPNSHGLRGVRYNKPGPNPWCAQITFRGINRHLGVFPTKEEAHEAYLAEHRELHGEFSHTNHVSAQGDPEGS